MRQLTEYLLKHKVQGAPMLVDGAYTFPHPKIRDYYIQIIASTGMGWEHVSVTLRERKKPGNFVQRCPTWAEMSYVKTLFWDDDEPAMQIHPPRSQHIDNHPFCLHLWKPINEEIPLPNKLMVGV